MSYVKIQITGAVTYKLRKMWSCQSLVPFWHFGKDSFHYLSVIILTMCYSGYVGTIDTRVIVDIQCYILLYVIKETWLANLSP